jgi:hypothetical protein
MCNKLHVEKKEINDKLETFPNDILKIQQDLLLIVSVIKTIYTSSSEYIGITNTDRHTTVNGRSEKHTSH